MKELQWFKDQELSIIICVLPDKQEKEVEILDEKDAKHYFAMQERGYTFKKKLRIHKSPPATCESCEG